MSDSTRVPVIVAGARTPMGKLLGSLKDFSGSDLGGFAIKGALDKAGVSGDQVQYVIMGQVLTAGEGQIPARQAAVKGGIPMNVPALTINKVCLSGIDAIALAAQLIRAMSGFSDTSFYLTLGLIAIGVGALMALAAPWVAARMRDAEPETA